MDILASLKPCQEGAISWDQVAEALLDEVRSAIGTDPQAAHSAALQLVSMLTPQAAAASQAGRGGLAPWQARKIERYLRAHLQRSLRLNTLAAQVSLSTSHFCRAFKESFGTTPHIYIMRRRLDLAQQLLLSTQDPLSQIALACGLADQAHLSKLFGRMTGESPSAWRRRNLSDAHVDARGRRATATAFGCEPTQDSATSAA